MLTHDNIVWTARSQLSTMQELETLDNNDHFVSYLPLSHIAAQMIDMHCPMMNGTQVWFAQPDALRGSLGKTLKEVRPTIFFGVPRVWEKIYDKLKEVGKTSSGVKKILVDWAKGQALQHWENNQYDGSKSTVLLFPLAQLLLGKVRDALGLDRVSLTDTAFNHHSALFFNLNSVSHRLKTSARHVLLVRHRMDNCPQAT